MDRHVWVVLCVVGSWRSKRRDFWDEEKLLGKKKMLSDLNGGLCTKLAWVWHWAMVLQVT